MTCNSLLVIVSDEYPSEIVVHLSVLNLFFVPVSSVVAQALCGLKLAAVFNVHCKQSYVFIILRKMMAKNGLYCCSIVRTDLWPAQSMVGKQCIVFAIEVAYSIASVFCHIQDKMLHVEECGSYFHCARFWFVLTESLVWVLTLLSQHQWQIDSLVLLDQELKTVLTTK